MIRSRISADKESEMKEQDITLSVIIPCYNEAKTIETVIDSVRNCGVTNTEIIVVDDCSRDGSRELLCGRLREKIDQLVLQDRNMGKGAALAAGFKHATGDVVAIQDADLEYNPKEFTRLIKPFLRDDDRRADVVYGSRYARGEIYVVESYWHAWGNRFLTWLSNIKTNLWLTDMETCYKLFKREVIQSIEIKEHRFGFEPEITAKIAKGHKYRIFEMPISYYPRTYDAGKKIGIKDGFRAIYCIFKY